MFLLSCYSFELWETNDSNKHNAIRIRTKNELVRTLREDLYSNAMQWLLFILTEK